MLAIDCGANIGVHTIEWAKHMTGWGSVMAIEAQERIYYALAGNIAINNCFNARALHAAATDKGGILKMPQPEYLAVGSLGSFELRQSASTEFIGQSIDYSEGGLHPVQAIAIDGLELPRIDLIKMDIEGMEIEALAGAAQSIAAHKPVLLIETIKSDARALFNWLVERDYRLFELWDGVLAVQASDPILPQVKCNEWKSRP